MMAGSDVTVPYLGDILKQAFCKPSSGRLVNSLA